MKKIPLTRNRYALVDDQDYEWAMQWKWSAGQVYENHIYAMRSEKGKTIYLHRELMKRIEPCPDPDQRYVDHRDGDTLDDRRSNIRWVTPSENSRNTYLKRAEAYA